MEENNKKNSSVKNKNIWSLIAGLLFLGIGSYRIYNHFYVADIASSNFRLALAVVFIGYGIYRIYNYLTN